MKQTIDLKNLGLRELNLGEAIETDGGVIPIVATWFGVCGLAYYAGYGAHALYDALTD